MIIMKFGGTSVEDVAAINRLTHIVETRLSRKPMVVVSALAKTTDALHQVVISASRGKLTLAKKKIKALQHKHLSICKDLITDEELFNQTIVKINAYFSEINDLLRGIYLLLEISNRTIAKILSYGELMSSAIIYAAMTQHGIKSVLLNAREFMFTDNNYLQATPDFELIKQKASKTIKNYINKGYVVLTQGFIANTKEGITTTLGRGGSDYSASIIGMSLDAEEIEIWTDVEGILTADPKKVKNTKLIPTISFSEAAELAYFGAKILHPLTIQPAIKKNIPVRILNSMNPKNKGTVILSDSKTSRTVIKSITCKENIKVLNIFSTRMLNSYGFLKRVFEVFEKNQTSVDVITTSEVNISLTLDNEEHIDKIMQELSHFAEVNVENDKSLVCLVGKNLKNTKGIIKRVFQVVGNFNITMISLGASVINLSFVINRNDLLSVLQKLHNEFFGS